jgi:hypothetical protein
MELLDPEQKKVWEHRFDVFQRLGFDIEIASLMAHRIDIDLHEATELVEAGCPLPIAVDILT